MSLKLVIGFHLEMSSEANRFRRVFNRYLDNLRNVNVSESYAISKLRLLDLSNFNIEDISIKDLIDSDYSFEKYSYSNIDRDSNIVLGIGKFKIDNGSFKTRLVYGDGCMVPVYFEDKLITDYSSHSDEYNYKLIRIVSLGNDLCRCYELNIYIDITNLKMFMVLGKALVYGECPSSGDYKSYSRFAGFKIILDNLSYNSLPLGFMTLISNNFVLFDKVAGIYLDGSMGDTEFIAPSTVEKLVLLGRGEGEDSWSTMKIVIPSSVRYVSCYDLRDSLDSDGGIHLVLYISKQASVELLESIYNGVNLFSLDFNKLKISKKKALDKLKYECYSLEVIEY